MQNGEIDMPLPTRPVTTNTIRDDRAVNTSLQGTGQNDHIIHHRAPDVGSGVANTTLYGSSGNDILEASVPTNGQIHMYGGSGDDWFVLDVTKNPGPDSSVQGHHVYAGPGRATYQFVNVAQADAIILGRLDTFAYQNDVLIIEDQLIDLKDLPRTLSLPGGEQVFVRVVEVEQFSILGEGLGPQQFLAIGDNIFYALEGARELSNGDIGTREGDENHFTFHFQTREMLRQAEPVDYIDPQNFVPGDFQGFRDVAFFWRMQSREVSFAESPEGIEYYANINNETILGSSGDDVINGVNKNKVIFAGGGDDLVAGGIDNDALHGEAGNDMLWGGDGEDSLFGGEGDDFLDGGRGNDHLQGGAGSDTLVGGRGDDILTGSGEDRAEGDANRFHFADGDGHDVITDFDLDADLITFQDDVDPATLRIWQDEDANTMIYYGEDSSVRLQGLSLAEFQEAAQVRAGEGNPVITVTPDPEREILRDLRLENGRDQNSEPEDLEMDGVLYGADAFNEETPGGYRYEAPSLSSRENRDRTPEEGDEEEGSIDLTCFIATATYGDPHHPDVVFLRAFRDEFLVHRAWGRAFIRFYWTVGPVMAKRLHNRHRLAGICRTFLQFLVTFMKK